LFHLKRPSERTPLVVRCTGARHAALGSSIFCRSNFL
jgi:hypothetical protein